MANPAHQSMARLTAPTSWWSQLRGRITKLFRRPLITTNVRAQLSLSRYFPRGTEYFYGFPAGSDSNFYNAVPPWVEELVAARPILFAGLAVSVVAFASSLDPTVWSIMVNDLQLPLVERSQIIELPKSITASVVGAARNVRMKRALAQLTHPGQFVMAQPYLDEALSERYRIAPEIITNLNVKQSIFKYVPRTFRPLQYATFPDGPSFAASTDHWPLPFVVKIAASSSGDGVRICYDHTSVTAVRREFRAILTTIFIEEFILAKQNIGVLFGVPQDQNYPVEVIGHHFQVTTNQGAFLGGIFNVPSANQSPALPSVYDVLSREVLSKVRALGWYGIGGVDVLIDQRDRFYIIDVNFRVTGTTAFSFYLKNLRIETPLMSFSGVYKGSLEQFRQTIVPLAKPGRDQQLIIVALTRGGKEVRFNAGILFRDEAQLYARAKKLTELGVSAAVFENIENLKSLRNAFH